MVLAIEQAPCREAAVGQLRTDIELPGALRYLDRLRRSIHGVLAAICGLEPARLAAVAPTLQAFAAALGTNSVLMRLRASLTHYLPLLPAPFGFDPRRHRRDTAAVRRQHRTGADPPTAILEAVHVRPICARLTMESSDDR